MDFLEKVQPYITSDNNTLRNFSLQVIENSHLGTEETFFLALEALDKVTPNALTNPVLPYTRNIPITDTIAEEIIKRLKVKDANFSWYAQIIERFPVHLLKKHQNELSEFVNQDAIRNMIILQSMDEEKLVKTSEDIIVKLENKGFNQHVFNHGKRVFKELANRKASNDLIVNQIKNAIDTEITEDFMSYKSIFNIYLAGEQRESALIPDLAGLIVRVEEHVLIDEVIAALIKIGRDDVLIAVEKYLDNQDTILAALEIVKNIKHPFAEELLLKHFDLATDTATKTLMAEGLCEQLSTQAIPKIETLMDKNDTQGQLDLTEVIYPNCVINEIDHSQLETWKNELQREEKKWELFRKEQILKTAKSQGINRNDICVCGSGKKFKKCCGA